MAANDAAIEVRRSAKQREQEEVEAILAYQAMKVPSVHVPPRTSSPLRGGCMCISSRVASRGSSDSRDFPSTSQKYILRQHHDDAQLVWIVIIIVLSRETIVHRTHGTHKNLHMRAFLLKVFGPI